MPARISIDCFRGSCAFARRCLGSRWWGRFHPRTNFFGVFFLLPRFALQGYLTQGTGKIYHTEEGGSTPPWDGGDGMPPNQDPPSWTPGGADGRPNSMTDVNAVAPMVGCGAGTVRHFPEGCGINATLEGVVPPGVHALCDKVIGDDALAKLQRAARNKNATGQPFFLAVGFRKPHTAWRFPAPYLDFYQNRSAGAGIDVAAHPVLDRSVPPIAISSFDFQPDPYVAMATAEAQADRLAYYASVSWMDHQVGQVLDELESLGMTSSTAIVFHVPFWLGLGNSTISPVLPPPPPPSSSFLPPSHLSIATHHTHLASQSC